MPYKRREHDRACRCDRGGAGCAAMAVQRLSRTRVRELAEEIWTVSTGTTVPVQPFLDPRGSRPGASAQAAYRRRCHAEREQWRDGWRCRWRLWFHPSASSRFWRRQALVQRRTAAMLAQLEQEGWLVLHDIALPGWSASLDHLVIGPTGTGIHVQPLLCLRVGIRPPGRRSVQGIPLVALRRLPDILRQGSRVRAIEVERASARALEVLRPAA
jgi:hypothetical protein